MNEELKQKEAVRTAIANYINAQTKIVLDGIQEIDVVECPKTKSKFDKDRGIILVEPIAISETDEYTWFVKAKLALWTSTNNGTKTFDVIFSAKCSLLCSYNIWTAQIESCMFDKQ